MGSEFFFSVVRRYRLAPVLRLEIRCLVVVGRWEIRYRGFGCAGGDDDWFEAHLLLFDL